MEISYNVDSKGVLHIYINNEILADVSDCNNMNQDQLNNLVDELLYELNINPN